MPSPLSAASQMLVSQLPPEAREQATANLQLLEEERNKHRAVSIALTAASERGKARGSSMDWDDVDVAIELAMKALGPEYVQMIRESVYQNEGLKPPEE